MKNIKTYLKKNGFFVFLLTVILLIIIALSVYIFVNTQEQREPAKPAVTTPAPEPAKKTAEITQFEGEYRKDLKYIDVSWSYEKHNSSINGVGLYINDTYVDNVLDYSSYQISKDAFHYPTGENVLKLVLNLSNGKTVEKTTKVFVNYVVSMEQQVKQAGNATEVTLIYQYDEAHPVDVPSIFITDVSIVSGEIKYIGTKRKTKDGSVFAETTYQINWPEAVVTYQLFDVRWSFKDIQYSKDFQAEKGKAGQGNE